MSRDVVDHRAQIAAKRLTISAAAEPSWKRPALLVGGAFVGTVLGGGKGDEVRRVVPLGTPVEGFATPVAEGPGTPILPLAVPGRDVSWIWPSENCETGATVAGVGTDEIAAQGVVWPWT